MNTKVLVTGATSGLGLNLCLALLNQGTDVVASGRNKRIGALLQAKGASFKPVDLQDEKAVQDACRGIQTVFHCGAKSSAWGRFDDFYKVNVEGTRHIITACLKHGVERLVYVSTPSLYFRYQHQLNIAETSPLPLHFVNAYATTKWMAEQAVQRAYHDHQLPVMTIRPRGIFGPHDQNIIPRLMRAAGEGSVPIIGDGMQITDVTYVENVVQSLQLCASADIAFEGRVYNVTNGAPLPLLTLLEKVWGALGRPFRPRFIPYPLAYSLAWMLEKKAKMCPDSPEPRLTRYGVGAMHYTQTLDISAIKQDLGYSPLVSIDEGLARYASWLNEREHADESM